MAPGVLALLVSLVPVASLVWHRQVPYSADFFRCLVLSELFSDAIAAGAWYPRWIPDMAGGHGYPQFVFYQPGYFFLSHAFSLVDDPLVRSAMALGAVAVAGGLGAYRLIRCFVSPWASLFFLLMFELTPYHFTDIYVRGDLTEWMVLQLSPWPLYLLYRLARTPPDTRAQPRLAIGLALALTCMAYAHPVTYVLFLPAFAAMACALGFCVAPRDRLAFFARTALGTLVAVALSSPYWLTVVALLPYVDSGVALGGHFDPSLHLLSPLAFFWSGADPLSRRLGLSFELGPVHFVLALGGAWLARKNPFVVAAFVIYAVLLVSMTPIAAPVWSLYPLYLVQFPWRLLTVIAVFQLICMLGLGKLAGLGRGMSVAGAVALIVVTVAWHRDALAFRPMPAEVFELPANRTRIAGLFPPERGFVPFDVAAPQGRDMKIAVANVRRALPLRWFGTMDMGEWVPKTALAGPLRLPRGESFLDLESGSASWQPLGGSTKFRLDYLIDAATPSAVVVNQLYLPGWRVVLDGRALSSRTLRGAVLPDGRMVVNVDPGRHRLQAWYDGPPGWRWRTLAMVALVGACVPLLFWRWTRTPVR